MRENSLSLSLSRGDLEVLAYLPGDAAATYADYWMEHFREPEEARGGELDRVPEERERGALRRDPASQERLWRRLGAAFRVERSRRRDVFALVVRRVFPFLEGAGEQTDAEERAGGEGEGGIRFGSGQARGKRNVKRRRDFFFSLLIFFSSFSHSLLLFLTFFLACASLSLSLSRDGNFRREERIFFSLLLFFLSLSPSLPHIQRWISVNMSGEKPQLISKFGTKR